MYFQIPRARDPFTALLLHLYLYSHSAQYVYIISFEQLG